MSEYYDAETDEEYVRAMQARINDGSIWMLEGSAGRAAMGLIESGVCAVGIEAHRDYWGNRVPARYMLEPGSFGTVEFVEAHGNVVYDPE